MPSFLIRGLARYFAASAMESRARHQSSFTPTSATSSDDEKQISASELAIWQTQMRWLIPFVQATGNQVIIDNPKSHEQIIIDQNTNQLPELTLEWMQKYNKQELLEWIAMERVRHLKEEEERQSELQARRIAEIRGRERFGNSFTLKEKNIKVNANHNQINNTKWSGNYIIPLLCFFIIILILFGLVVYNSSVFSFERHEKESQKYSALLNEAESSPITELVTPEGFRFDMNEDEFNAQNKQRKTSEVDYLTKSDWQFGNLHYTGYNIYDEEFHKGKLCSYLYRIEGQILNGSFNKLDDYDIKRICEYYKAFLDKDYTFTEFPELLWGGNVYVFTKSNMVITLNYQYRELLIKCENRPVSAPIEREKFRKNEEEGKYKYRPRFESQYPYSRL